MSRENVCVLVYDSIHDVMKAESTLKRVALWCDLIPTPRQISSECGMSLEVHSRDIKRVLEMVGKGDDSLSIYKKTGEDYSLISN